jgi:hypothetical protein
MIRCPVVIAFLNVRRLAAQPRDHEHSVAMVELCFKFKTASSPRRRSLLRSIESA